MWFLHLIWRLLRGIVQRFDSDRCLRTASALSFTSVLAMVPFVTVIFSMLAIFPVFQEWSGSIENFLFKNFVPTAGDTVKDHLQTFAANSGKLTAVGLGFLFISSISLLSTIESSFNDIWRVKQSRSTFQRLLTYWAVLTLVPLLLVVSLSISSALFSLKFFSEGEIMTQLTARFLGLLPMFLEIIAFILFYKAIPNCEVRARSALIGGLIGVMLFEFAKYFFTLFVINFNSYELIYGALATLPIFLLWIFLSWMVLLIGALVAAELDEYFDMQEGIINAPAVT